MKLNISNIPNIYYIIIRNIGETVFGSILIIFGIVYSIVFANIITNTIFPNIKNENNKSIKFIMLCIHIIIILLFIMIIRFLAPYFILNRLILDGIFSFIGPTIAASSLYYISDIKTLIS